MVLAMLADPKAAEDVGKKIAEGIKEGKGYVDVSTIDGDTAKRIADVRCHFMIELLSTQGFDRLSLQSNIIMARLPCRQNLRVEDN